MKKLKLNIHFNLELVILKNGNAEKGSCNPQQSASNAQSDFSSDPDSNETKPRSNVPASVNKSNTPDDYFSNITKLVAWEKLTTINVSTKICTNKWPILCPTKYQVKKFFWPMGRNTRIKNEPADTPGARNHLLSETIRFINSSRTKLNQIKTLEEVGFKLVDVHNSSTDTLESNLFGTGRTDLVFAPSFSESPYQFRTMINVELKSIDIEKTGKFKPNVTSNAEYDKLSGQITAQLIAASKMSEFAILQFTTDLHSNFNIWILSTDDNDKFIFKWSVTAEESIAIIVYWLFDVVSKKTRNNVSFLNGLDIARKHVKEAENRLEKIQILPESGVQEDYKSKCEKWVYLNQNNFKKFPFNFN